MSKTFWAHKNKRAANATLIVDGKSLDAPRKMRKNI